MGIELEPVALEPASRRERRRGGPLLPQPDRKVSRRRRWRRLGTALAAAVMVALAGIGRLTGDGPAGSLHRDGGLPVSSGGNGRSTSATPPSLKPLSPGWRLVRRAPIASRHGAISAWTGRDLLVWGGVAGGRPLTDGAAYHPDTDQWRSLSPSPLPAREGATSAWTGQEWIVWGGMVAGEHTADGAAYDPDTGAWRVLPPAPMASSGAQAVWTGREVLVWGGSAGSDGAAYDPRGDRWRRLPRGGPHDVVGAVLWTDRELLVLSFSDPAAFDPATNRWRRLPLPPVTPWITRNVVWTGTEVLAVGGSDGTGRVPDGAAYDPVTNRWRTLAAAPDPVDVSDATATWTGRLLVVARGPSRVQVYDPAADTWDVMPGLSEGPRVGSSAAWTGEEMVFWGGYGVLGTPAVREEGVAWRPSPSTRPLDLEAREASSPASALPPAPQSIPWTVFRRDDGFLSSVLVESPIALGQAVRGGPLCRPDIGTAPRHGSVGWSAAMCSAV